MNSAFYHRPGKVIAGLVTACLSFILLSCGNNNVLKEVKKLDYPSASGIETLVSNFYIMGDDANSLLITDAQFKPIDSIKLYDFPGKRISKQVKPDLEAMALTIDNKLLILGSGSVDPTRNIAWLIDPLKKQKDSIRLDMFYHRLKLEGIRDINIEGACSIPGTMLLANRGNKSYPKNQLIFTSREFWRQQSTASISVVRVGYNTDSSSFSGVSGLAYASGSGSLVMTVSTEDTRNNVDDGAIGKSYLWIVKDISAKSRWSAINPDQIVDLEAVDSRFRGQKIESVCISRETSGLLYLVLAADNDDGSSTLFRMIVEKD